MTIALFLSWLGQELDDLCCLFCRFLSLGSGVALRTFSCLSSVVQRRFDFALNYVMPQVTVSYANVSSRVSLIIIYPAMILVVLSMFCDHVLSVAIAVTGCLCFSRLQYPRLVEKEGKNACKENQKGRENEKSTTWGIPRRSPIQVLTLPDRLR